MPWALALRPPQRLFCEAPIMKKHLSSFLAVSLGIAALAAGCSTAPAPSAGTGGHTGTGTGGSTTGSGGSSTGSGGQVGTGMAVLLTPSPSGFVDAASNSLGVIGAWFAYGDGYEGGMAPGKCQASGHMTSECSVITMPTLPPGAAGFPPNASGAMCTAGTVAKVIPIPGMAALDYSNMYGAGIGLDLNNPGGANAVKGAFNATMKGVTGISFDIGAPPLADCASSSRPRPTTPLRGRTTGVRRPPALFRIRP